MVGIKLSGQSNMANLGVFSAPDLALPSFLASVFGSAELSLKLLPSSLTQLGGTNDVNYKYYMDTWQSITKTQTPDSSIAANQKTWSHHLKRCCLLPKLRQAKLALLRLQHHLLERSYRPFQCLQLVPVLTTHP